MARHSETSSSGLQSHKIRSAAYAHGCLCGPMYQFRVNGHILVNSCMCPTVSCRWTHAATQDAPCIHLHERWWTHAAAYPACVHISPFRGHAHVQELEFHGHIQDFGNICMCPWSPEYCDMDTCSCMCPWQQNSAQRRGCWLNMCTRPQQTRCHVLPSQFSTLQLNTTLVCIVRARKTSIWKFYLFATDSISNTQRYTFLLVGGCWLNVRATATNALLRAV